MGRSLAAQPLEQFLDVFELLQRRPVRVAPPPAVAARRDDHGERLGEVFERMALRVVQPEMKDVAPARGIRTVLLGIALRRTSEELAPALLASEAVGVVERVPAFVAEDLHHLLP